LHRDLKPVNIFLDGDLNVKLGDFGLSKKLIEGKSFASTNVGSPYYMSPELFLNVPYDEKIDIWSAGCIIYEMAALEQPFKASSIGELGEKIKLGVFKRINQSYSDDLQRLIKMCLEVDPKNRPNVNQILEHPRLQ